MIGEVGGYRIKRIRLVNFHNVSNATIEVNGHLFLLGDNGSGKTTILDAVQYVLTGGGNLMEFNSAARMAGSRQDGRRVQGIVLRYNVDTGPMNPVGGVSYAALELTDDRDNLLTIGVGLSAYSMEERVQRWGIIISAPLESVPWLTDEGGRVKVTEQKQMRDTLMAKGAFYSIGAYEKELARRIFNNEEIFAETCRFLSMGKAYREIAASAADYHHLFKTLLPEPKTDLFERIIDSLKTLDEANQLLEDMEKKFQYLSSLEEQVKTISDQRESIVRYGWLKIHFERNSISKRIGGIDNELEQIKKQKIELSRQISSCRDQQVALQRRMDDLRSADSAGLVRQEKELAQDIASRKKSLEIIEQTLTDVSGVVNAAEKQCDRLKIELCSRISTLSNAIKDASTLEPQLCAQRISSLECVVASEHIISEIQLMTVDDICGKIEEHLRDFHREQDKLREQHEKLRIEYEVHCKEREVLLGADALKPQVPGLNEVLSALGDAGIDCKLLYEQLEWSEQLDSDARSFIEECIGLDILSIIMVEQRDREMAKRIVFETAPSVKLYFLQEQQGDVPDWIRTSFDLRTTHPEAVRCLAGEMISQNQPFVEKINGSSILSFRSHRQRLTGECSRWIGQEERRNALRNRIAELNQKITALEDECNGLQTKITCFERTIKTTVQIRDKIVTGMRTVVSVSEELKRAVQEYSLRKESLEKESRSYGESRDECDRMQARHETLLDMIKREGLEELERRISLLSDEMIILDEKYRSDISKEGMLQGKVDSLQKERADSEARNADLEIEMMTFEQKISVIVLPQPTDIPHYILRTKQGASFKTTESIEIAIRDAQRKESTAIGSLNEKLRDPRFGSIYGFSYNEAENRLVDRRERLIADLTVSERIAIDEQRQVINEKTSELFKKIIVNEMVSFFAGHLSRLEQMVRTINDLLSQRTFGTTRYRLELQKEERFAPFIEAVRRFNPFSTGSEDVLRQFIDDHREEIINSEIESIPPVLDYRNWYTYHLRMFTSNNDGILIDRRTKSVGSGGEQAVPNYLTILTIAQFLFKGNAVKLCTLLFDEAFYGIDAGRRDQLLGFASDIGLQLMVASPDQDGVRKEIPSSTTLLVVKDPGHNVHLYPFHYENPAEKQVDLFDDPEKEEPVQFGEELGFETDRM